MVCCSPLKWVREVTEHLDGFATTSVGECQAGTKGWAFYLGLVVFHVVCLCYALVLCFQTKDINSDFAESSFVSLAVAFMFQVLVLVAPISALVHENTDVFYFIRATAVFLQNFTVLVLIFVPKIVRKVEEDRCPSPRAKRVSLSKKVEQRASTRRSASVTRNQPSWGGASLSSNDLSGSIGALDIRPSELEAIQEEDNEMSSYSNQWAMEQAPKSVELAKTSRFTSSFDSTTEQASVDAKQPSFLLGEEILANWEKLGFSTEEFAQQVVGLLSRSTDVESRRSVSSEIIGHTQANNSPHEDGVQPLSPNEILSEWEALGFPTENVAKQLVSLLNRETDSATRKNLFLNIMAEEEGTPLLSAKKVRSDWEELGFASKDVAQLIVGLLSRETDYETRRTISLDLVQHYERSRSHFVAGEGISGEIKHDEADLLDSLEACEFLARPNSRSGPEPKQEEFRFL